MSSTLDELINFAVSEKLRDARNKTLSMISELIAEKAKDCTSVEELVKEVQKALIEGYELFKKQEN